jgi:hypothetical protein
MAIPAAKPKNPVTFVVIFVATLSTRPPDLKRGAQKDLEETQTQFPSFLFSSLPSVERTEGNEESKEGRPGI